MRSPLPHLAALCRVSPVLQASRRPLRPIIAALLLTLACLFPGGSSTARGEDLLVFPQRPVDSQLAELAKAIESLHRQALRSKAEWTEEDLRQKIPSRYLKLDARYLALKDSEAKARALAELALLYAELAWVERIRPLSEALRKIDAKLADRLGHFEESKHFLARVAGADAKWAEAAVKLGEAAREGYLARFGFRDISKVPGKKIRIVIHLDPAIAQTRLYFHPTPLYHGEIRYEIPDEKFLTVSGGRRVVYGICHELGHMLAMWGDYFKKIEDDHHAWAHYTGCHVVEEVYERLGNSPWPTWTAFQRKASGLERLRKEVEGVKPGKGSREGVLAILDAVGEDLGTKIYGEAFAWLEKQKRFRRINNVPYLWLKDLEEALTRVAPREKAARVREIFAGG